MSHTAIVRTRIDDRTRAEAAAVLARIGMTVSDFVELMLRRVARDKALPFEAFEPHAEKIEAMEEARRGGLQSFATIEELMADLNADD